MSYYWNAAGQCYPLPERPLEDNDALGIGRYVPAGSDSDSEEEDNDECEEPL